MICSCGETHEKLDAVLVRLEIAETVILAQTVPPLHAWRVPRVFVLAHRIRGEELPALAEQYGWPRER